MLVIVKKKSPNYVQSAAVTQLISVICSTAITQPCAIVCTAVVALMLFNWWGSQQKKTPCSGRVCVHVCACSRELREQYCRKKNHCNCLIFKII